MTRLDLLSENERDELVKMRTLDVLSDKENLDVLGENDKRGFYFFSLAQSDI